VIGYPLGEYLAFSLQDNKIVGASDELLHYRSPTRPGSSGSPLFDSEWQLVGLHHAGKENLARIDDPDATYAANEGFLLTAVQAAMRRDPPA
jgi:V8-like Glu-specific endopeptidase